MKKFIIFGLLVALLLSACSSTKYPMSEKHKKYGEQALKIVDAYLDFEITAEEAESRIRSLVKSAKSLPEAANKDEEFGNGRVVAKVEYIQSAFALVNMGGSSHIADARDDLAELLGK